MKAPLWGFVERTTIHERIKPMNYSPENGRSFRIRGMDCAEEVAILKREVGPLVGGESRLSFDILKARMTVDRPAGLPFADSW